MMLHYMIVKTVILVGLIAMHKKGCSGETRVVLHVHELGSIVILIIIIMSSPRRRGSMRVRLPWCMQTKGRTEG